MEDIKKSNTESEAEREFKKKLADLEKRYHELETFSYTVTHDLKAPLRAINNLSLWIEEDLGPAVSGDIRNNMNMLRSRLQRMENLINGILQYSKAGRISAERTPVHLGELIRDIIEVLSPPKEFQFDISAQLPALSTQKVALEQVFQNLLSNAIKFHPRTNGKVTVSCRESGDFYEFSVADDGIGIEPEFHDKIFEPFQSLQSKDKVEGTGIGLAIVKKVVESRGGTIRLISDKGKGAALVFTWPKNG